MWEWWTLRDEVIAGGRRYYGVFRVFAPNRQQAHVTARLHLSALLHEAGLL